jgi:predicted nucleic acid-binding protein
VKLYADEAGHKAIRALQAPLVVSTLARVEVPAAIWRKQRTGEIDINDALVLTRAFEADYAGAPDKPPRFVAVEVSDEVLRRGAQLVANHGLRAYDAVQLASALRTRELDERCETFAAFDQGLVRAAVSEGLKPFPPERRAPTQAPPARRG